MARATWLVSTTKWTSSPAIRIWSSPSGMNNRSPRAMPTHDQVQVGNR